MKKMYFLSLGYLIFGLASGLFHQEVSYWTNFEGESVLARVHPHALVLGAVVFMLIPLMMKTFKIQNQKSFRWFFILYNLGLIVTLGFMTARGLVQLFTIPIPSFVDHMIGGFAGIGHVILTIGIGFLFHALIKSSNSDPANELNE